MFWILKDIEYLILKFLNYHMNMFQSKIKFRLLKFGPKKMYLKKIEFKSFKAKQFAPIKFEPKYVDLKKFRL